MEWYVLNVFNGKEKKVKENIEKQLEEKSMTKYVANILIPKEKYFQVKNGKKVKSERNYMPGYIMIQCDMNDELLSTIKHANGVIKFLGQDSPEPMRENEVKRMLEKTDELKQTEEVFEHSLIVGQMVKIVDGPFATMHGTITKISPEKKRVSVDVNIFNRKTPLELNIEQVIND
jgi:transcriptional antiterminator NusG